MRRALPTSLFLLAAFALSSCGSTGTSSKTPDPPPNTPPTDSVSVTISPTTANIRTGASLTFAATVTGSSNQSVIWSVNQTTGGSSTLGTINSSGNYTAPATLPSPNTVTIAAASTADSSKYATSAVTLLNPTPVLTGISPAATNLGNFTLTITGSAFVSGAQVVLNGSSLTTTFLSSTQLTAVGSLSTAGTFSVAVQNPDPGSSTSNSLNFQVNGSTQTSNCGSMSSGQGASLNGFVPFPSDNLWNTDISSAPVDPNSAAIINFIGGSVGLHPDFGAGLYNSSSIGIPYTVVDSSQPLLPIDYTAYGSESDAGPMPIPLTAPIEGYPNPGSGDRHVLVLDTNTCFLYELYSSYPQSTYWNAASGAVWDLTADERRPYTWTSADAAGLPIFPGLVRYDEVAQGAINHAIRFTVQNSRAGFTPPASHWAATTSAQYAPPMGMRMRLKSSFDISSFSAANQVILNAMKKYGIIVADNGSSMYISGAPDDRWSNDDLHTLGAVTASDFDVLEITPLYTSSNVPSGASPTISQLNASATSVAAGTPVTLSWQATGASYIILSPEIGATRGSSATVHPSATTTYTLYANNAYGQTTATITIAVQ
ncbi:MAG TPA: IPT/TIG domain-containing protein [Candidatus Acidoferrum sp.]|nr:IPT/TIG domain-containing protein [Candidatus Acidoferrum sp.]